MVVKCSDHNPRNPADPAVCLPSPARGHSPGHCLVLPSASRQLLQRVPWPRLVTPAPSLATSTLVPMISPHLAAQAVGKDPALHPSTCNHSVASCCLWSKPQAWLSGPKYWTWPLPTSSSSSLSQAPLPFIPQRSLGMPHPVPLGSGRYCLLCRVSFLLALLIPTQPSRLSMAPWTTPVSPE